MPTQPFQKPLLPSHYSVWFEPPDEAGDEVLRVVSERRSIKLKGHSFREFHQRVIPLLDGRHTLEQIQQETADVFRPEDLSAALQMLGDQGVLADAEVDGLSEEVAERIEPQLNYFHEMTEEGRDLQSKLSNASVAVVGLGGAGASTALALAAAGVGELRCIDPNPVAASDIYISPFYDLSQVGSGRAETLVRKVQASAPQVKALGVEQRLDSEDAVREAVAGADFTVCCLDSGEVNFAYKLNRVCLDDGLRWIACSLAGGEVTVGPAMHPGDSPCYMCYRMRAVACAGNPEAAFDFEKYLDRRKKDDSPHRENLVFGAGIAANLLGMETLKELTGMAEPSLVGRILTVGLADLGIHRHTVLRKPWCPACYKQPEAAAHAG